MAVFVFIFFFRRMEKGVERGERDTFIYLNFVNL